MSVLVEARALVKSFRDGVVPVEVLRGVDLRVEPEEMVAIVGPSGSGKSTLLHLIGTLDRPDSGTIEIAGVSVAGLPPRELAAFRNRTIGFVFQFHQLLADFTALENVTLPGRIAGEEPRRTTARATELLASVGLAERATHFPNQLSGGERQRVALCRAVILEPALLLADEPTGNLDPESGEGVLDLLFALRRRTRTTTVLVTHNPEVAQRCGRILRLETGLLHASSVRPTSEGVSG
jgi:lipoprotein-releasing system ATP-binding protein